MIVHLLSHIWYTLEGTNILTNLTYSDAPIDNYLLPPFMMTSCLNFYNNGYHSQGFYFPHVDNQHCGALASSKPEPPGAWAFRSRNLPEPSGAWAFRRRNLSEPTFLGQSQNRTIRIWAILQLLVKHSRLMYYYSWSCKPEKGFPKPGAWATDVADQTRRRSATPVTSYNPSFIKCTLSNTAVKKHTRTVWCPRKIRRQE